MGVWYGGNARYSETAEQRDPMRTCKHCGLTMPLSQFPMHPNRSGVLKDADAREVVFCEACRFYCEEEGEGVCALISLFAEGGRVVFRVLPKDFCAWGAESGQ